MAARGKDKAAGKAAGTEPIRAAIYCRVSTDEQMDSGLSMATQEERCRARIVSEGMRADGVYRDSRSGRDLRRPGLQRLLADAKAGKFGAIIVHALSRLTRGGARDHDYLMDLFRKHSVRLVSLSEHVDVSTARGRFQYRLNGILDQNTREEIGEKTRQVLQDKRKRGEVYGPIPFGFRRRGDRLVKDVGEQATLALIRRRHAQGCSMTSTAQLLNWRGVPAKSGKRWWPSTVRSVLLERAIDHDDE